MDTLQQATTWQGALGLRDRVDWILSVPAAVECGRYRPIEAKLVEPRDDLNLLSEPELVQRAQSDLLGETGRDATCVLFGRYQERVYSWCYRHLRDHDRSLEVSQDVFLRAYRHLGGFSAQGSFSAWLFAITRNRCRSALRLPSWVRDEGVDPDTVESPGSSPEDEEIDGESVASVTELIREHLEPLEQEALWLRCAEGMPVEEITRTLRIEDRTGARAVLQRARRKLRAGIAARERQERERQGRERPERGRLERERQERERLAPQRQGRERPERGCLERERAKGERQQRDRLKGERSGKEVGR